MLTILFPIAYVLYLIKIIEIALAVIWTFKEGIDQSLNRKIEYLKMARGNCFNAICKIFNDLNHPSIHIKEKGLNKTFSVFKNKHIYRFPVLFIATSFSLILLYLYSSLFFTFTFSNTFWYISIIALVLGLILEAGHMVVYRYRFGTNDNVIFALTMQNYDIWDKMYFIRNYFKIYGGIFLLLIFGFATIYSLLPNESGLFYNVCNKPLVFTRLSDYFQYLYFSITTICTVGFGDIYPGHWLSKLFVSLEMICGFGIFIMLLSAVALTSKR